MPRYKYEAIDNAGEVVKCEFTAVDEAALVLHLQQQNLLPVTIEDADVRSFNSILNMEIGGGNKVKPKDLEIVTAQLARLLKAGLPLDKALSILISVSASSPAIERLLGRIQESVRGGGNLATALEQQGSLFSSLYINMVRAGEVSGALDIVLARLAEFMAKSRQLKNTVISAMVYPLILLFVAISSILGLLVFVVPRFEKMFSQSGKALPLMTQMVVNTAHFLQSYGWVLMVLLIAVFFIFKKQLENKDFKYRYDKKILSFPLLGDLLCKTEIARFSRTLGTLLLNGVAIVPALTIVKETVTNSYIVEAVEAALENMKGGRNLSAPLQEAKVFPPMAVHMIKVGEETGQLDSMLSDVADLYDEEVQTTVKRILVLIEPLLIVIMGGVTLVIVLSIMLAVLASSDMG